MRFYVSDAHWKELSDGGCCCGLPETWNYSKGQLCQALQIAKKTGSVRWSDIEPHLTYTDTFSYRRALGLNTMSDEKRSKYFGRTMTEFIRWNWNSPEVVQSPYQFYDGVLVPIEKDEHGDLVYEWRGNDD